MTNLASSLRLRRGLARGAGATRIPAGVQAWTGLTWSK
jgi:hypothetical protein